MPQFSRGMANNHGRERSTQFLASVSRLTTADRLLAGRQAPGGCEFGILATDVDDAVGCSGPVGRGGDNGQPPLRRARRDVEAFRPSRICQLYIECVAER